MLSKKMRFSLFSLFLSGLLLAVMFVAGFPPFTRQTAHALNNGLALTPPMGWNPYNYWFLHQNTYAMNEATAKANADALVSSGMLAAGYQYVNLDGGWFSSTRDANGNIQPNADAYPGGIKALADYVHSKCVNGICEKFGLYGQPVMSRYHEQQDANTFASWGVDYLKYDYFYLDGAGTPEEQYRAMGDALKNTNRPIVYSINADGQSGSWRPEIANLWRTTDDIFNGTNNWNSISSILDNTNQTGGAAASLAGPGHWNDPDMLEVGNGMSVDEDRAHFSMWAIMAAPLIAGTDLPSMSTATRDIYTNTEVIAVDQDAAGKQGIKVSDTNGLQVWAKPLQDGSFAVALLNRTGSPANITGNWSSIGLPSGQATVRDLWQHSDKGTFTDSYTANSVPSHGVVVLKIKSTGSSGQTTSYEAESGSNTISGGAAVSSCGSCSGGQKVGYIGPNGGTLTFNNVNVSTGGTYAIVVSYTNGDSSRDIQVSANGGSASTISLAGTGGWDTVGTATVNVQLTAGNNTITFSNPSGWAPDIDRIQVTQSRSAQSIEAESSANTIAGGATISSCGGCSGGQKVGYIGTNGGSLTFNAVNVGSAGTYTLTIYYTNGDATRSALLSVNGGGGQNINFPGTGDWGTVGSLTVSISLSSGNNTLAFSKPDGWAPDFDRIAV